MNDMQRDVANGPSIRRAATEYMCMQTTFSCHDSEDIACEQELARS